MKLKRVRIENFRCYEDIEVEFDALTTIVVKDVPASAIVAGVPAKVLRIKE